MSRQVAAEQSGFTLVELVIGMTFALMFSALVIGFMLNFWSATATLEDDSQTFVTRQNAGDRLRDALNAASQLISQNSIDDANRHVAADATHWSIIHAIPGTTNMPSSGNYASVLYYESPSLNSSKSIVYSGSIPYYDEFILYLKGSTKQLLMRTLANSYATGNRLKTTCPPPSATSTCPADTVIASDVSSVSLRYFSRSGNTIDYTSSTDSSTGQYNGPDFPAVEVVEITLTLGRSAQLHGGQVTENQTIVRVALRNG